MLTAASSCAAEQVKEYLFLSPNLFGYIDKSGQQVIKPKFRRAEEFSEGVAAVSVGGKWAYIDHSGKLLGLPQFKYLPPLTGGMASVQIENRFYYVDRTGQQVMAAPHEEYSWTTGDTSRFSEGLAGVFVSHSTAATAGNPAPATTQKVGWSFIDKQGKLAIDGGFVAVRPFSEGLAGVRVDKKWGYIDKTGKTVIKPQFDWVQAFSEGFAAVQKGQSWVFIDKNGNLLGKLEFAAAGHFSEGMAAVRVNEKWGYIDKTGKIVIRPQYFMAREFRGELAPVAVVKKWGFINKTGELAISPEYRDARPFFDGLARVQVESGTGSAAYGYIDQKGAVVIQPAFESAGDFFEGLAYVSPTQTVVARIPALTTLLPPGKEHLVDLAKLTPNYKHPPVEKVLLAEGDTVSINLAGPASGATRREWLIRERSPRFFDYGHMRTATACLEQVESSRYRAIKPGKETLEVLAKQSSDRDTAGMLVDLDVQPVTGPIAADRAAKVKEIRAEFDKIARAELDNPQFDSYMQELRTIAHDKQSAFEIRQLAQDTLTILEKKRHPHKPKPPRPPAIRVRGG